MSNAKPGVRELISVYRALPCKDCGAEGPNTFDHLEFYPKCFDIPSQVGRGRTFTTIMREIEKCEVVCEKCHRDREAARNPIWRLNNPPRVIGRVFRLLGVLSGSQVLISEANYEYKLRNGKV